MRLPPSSTSPRAARRYVREVRDRASDGSGPFDPVRCDDIDLVVSELVTNVVMHARTDLELEAEVVDSELVLRVTDSGAGAPVMPGAAFGEHGGAGLSIVDRIASDWGIERTGGAKTIWCRLPLR